MIYFILIVDIKRGIFQGDSLSPLEFVKAAYEFSGSKEKMNHLLFMDDLKLYSRNEKELDSLVQTIRIFSEGIGIEFVIGKCAMLMIEKGKIAKSVGIELPDSKAISHYRKVKVISILEF